MPSALRGRASSASLTSVTVALPSTTATTPAVMGISTPWAAARSRTARADFAPSATPREARPASTTLMPSPRRRPKVWLRDRGLEQVATRSPRPAKPEKVSGTAPRASPSRVISTRPRVMMVALEMSPNPHPDAAPTARAMTFLTAPHSSTPSTSVFVYGLKVLVAHRAATRAATASSVAATTVAVG